MLKNDVWIKQQISQGMILNAAFDFQGKGLSRGVSSFGYDVTLADDLQYFNGDILDPKYVDPEDWMPLRNYGGAVLVPPHALVLGHSIEHFKLPRNITGLVFPKSTYARCGLSCCQTVLEAGWEGQITLEFNNLTSHPVVLYVGEGCAQVLFLSGNDCAQSYADRKGKYQNQTGVTFSKVL